MSRDDTEHQRARPTCLSARLVLSLRRGGSPSRAPSRGHWEGGGGSHLSGAHKDHPGPPAVPRHLPEYVTLQKGSDLLVQIFSVGIKWACVCWVLAEWGPDPAAKCYFLPRGENPMPGKPAAKLRPSQFGPIFLARLPFSATASVQPHPVPGKRRGPRQALLSWSSCEQVRGGGGGGGRERRGRSGGRREAASAPFLLESGQGDGGAVSGSAPSRLQLPRGEGCLSPCISVLFGIPSSFSHRNRLKRRLAPGLAQRSQTNSNTASKTLHPPPPSVTGGARTGASETTDPQAALPGKDSGGSGNLGLGQGQLLDTHTHTHPLPPPPPPTHVSICVCLDISKHRT